MTKPKQTNRPDPPPRVTTKGHTGGSIGNTDDSKRGRDLTPSRDNDPDAQESKA